MLLAYAVGVPVVATMLVHDALFAAYAKGENIAVNLSFLGLLLGGIGALSRGRDDWAAAVVPALTVVMSGATLITATGPNPVGFFDGWARWYAVFVTATVVFGPPRTSAVVTALSLGWTVAYYAAFCRGLAPALAEKALSETIEVSMVLTMTGALALAAIGLVQRAMDEAGRQLERSRRLAEELEARVVERTAALDEALAERLAILENLAEGLVAVDRAGRLRLTNPALARLYAGVTLPIGAPAADVLPADLSAAVSEASAGTGVERDVALPGRRVGRAACSPLGGGGVVALVRDVTLEREIDRMKTDFTATASHELRTPLTSILGFGKLASGRLGPIFERVAEPDERTRRHMAQVRENLEIIVREGERLTALIEDVLDISKMESGRMTWRSEPVDLLAVARASVEVVRPLFREGGPELRVDLPASPPPVTGDAHRLTQVLVNLLSNAAKFTERGHVALAIRETEEGTWVGVSDTGAGIEPALHEAVFEKFRQVGETLTGKPRGTGLGLPISRQIVRAHGAELHLDSALGEGSRFWFVLPRP